MTLDDSAEETSIRPRSRVILDGDTSEERLLELIEIDEEDDGLDFKRTYDLGTKKDQLECVKLLVCMANTGGGYAVLGVDKAPAGAPRRHVVVGCPDKDLAALEVTRFNDQLERFVEEPLQAVVVTHRPAKYGSVALPLIWVPPTRTLPLTFKIDGRYGFTDGKGKHHQEVVFLEGEVWIRRGARCVRANARDWRRVRSDIRRLERTQWTEDLLGVTPLVQRLDRLSALLERWVESGPPGVPIGSSTPLGAAEYLLPAGQLIDRVHAVLDTGEVARVRRFIQGAPKAFFEALDALETGSAEEAERGKDNHLRPILDAVAAAAMVASEYDGDEIARAAHEALWRIYERTNRTTFPRVRDVHLDAVWVWEEVIKRVYLLGAALVERWRFAAVSDLIEQPIDWDEYWEPHLWARHALTMMSRANRLERGGLVTAIVADLKKDASLAAAFGGDLDRATDRLCQFDFLQCVHVVHRQDDIHAGYPSFAWYYKQRTEPVIRALLSRPEVRQQAIPSMDDDRLAAIIAGLDAVAGREAFAVAGWRAYRWSDPTIRKFLEEHAPKDPDKPF